MISNPARRVSCLALKLLEKVHTELHEAQLFCDACDPFAIIITPFVTVWAKQSSFSQDTTAPLRAPPTLLKFSGTKNPDARLIALSMRPASVQPVDRWKDCAASNLVQGWDFRVRTISRICSWVKSGIWESPLQAAVDRSW